MIYALVVQATIAQAFAMLGFRDKRLISAIVCEGQKNGFKVIVGINYLAVMCFGTFVGFHL